MPDGCLRSRARERLPRSAADEGLGRETHGVTGHRFDLDDVGPQVGQDHRPERPGQVLAEIDDPDAAEGEGRGGGARRRCPRAPGTGGRAGPAPRRRVGQRPQDGLGVLSGKRLGPGHRTRRTEEMDGDAHLPGGAPLGVLHGGHRPVGQRLDMAQHVRRRHDGFGRVVVAPQFLHQVVTVPRPHPLPAPDVEGGPFGRGHAHQGEDVGGVVEADDLVERLERLQARHDRDVDPTAGGALEEHHLVDAGRVGLGHELVVAGRRVLDVLVELGGVEQRPLEQRRLHVLAAAGALAGGQGGQGAGTDQEGGAHGGHGHVQEDRPRAPTGLRPHLTAHRLHQGVVGRAGGQGMTRWVGRARDQDEPFVEGAQVLVAEAETAGHVGPEALDHHVGARRQPAELRPPVR